MAQCILNGGGLLDSMYPVGSIYLSINNTNPKLLFGGEWEQIQDKFLLGASSTYNAGSIGGTTKPYIKSFLGAEQVGYYAVVNQSESYTGEDKKWGFSINGCQELYIDPKKKRLFSSPETEDETTLPPYLAVYMWKRVR